MRNRTLYTKLAVEDIEADAVAPGEEAPAAPAVEGGLESLEAELIEVAKDIVEIAHDEETAEEVTEVADELEVAAEALQDIAKKGGLDQNGARVLNLYTASLNKRLGLPATHATLSQESFGGTMDRTQATKLAAESFKDKAAELWGKLCEMFRNAIKAIVAVWNRIFDGATRMKARATKLAAAATATKGEATNKTFESPKLAENLHINGTVDVMKAAEQVEKECSIVETIARAAVAAASTTAAVIEAGDLSKLKDIANSSSSVTQMGFSKVADPASVGFAAPGEGLELFKSEALPGNKAVIATVAGADAKPAAIGKIGYKLGTYDASKKVAEKTSLTTMSTADIGTLAKKIGNAADLIISFKKVQKEAEAAANKVISLAEKKAKEAGKDADGKAVEGALSGKDARQLATGAMSSNTNAAPPLVAFALNAGGYCLQFGEQSIKQYGKAKAEAPAAAPAAAAA